LAPGPKIAGNSSGTSLPRTKFASVMASCRAQREPSSSPYLSRFPITRRAWMRAHAFGPNDEQVVLVEQPRTTPSALVRSDMAPDSRCDRLDAELRHGDPLTRGDGLVFGLVHPVVPRHCGSAWSSRLAHHQCLSRPCRKRRRVAGENSSMR
jgi:hypothetical protein